MCGLIGYSGGKPADIDKLKLLIAYNEDRGKDSCGLYMSNPSTETKAVDRIQKFLGAAKTVLLPSFSFPNNIEVFIGHTRSKTSGAVVKDNSHPFHYPSPDGSYEIVGAHNGMVVNDEALMEKYGWKNTDWEVDSQLIFKGLAEFDDYRILKDMGWNSYALLWSKIEFIEGKKVETMYAFRKKDRTLFYGFTTDRLDPVQAMYISSTEESLKAIGCFEINPFEEDTLYVLKEGYEDEQIKIKCAPIYRTVTTTPSSSRSQGPASTGTNSRIGDSVSFTDDYEEFIKVDFVRSRYFGDNTNTETIIKRLEESAILNSLTAIDSIHADHDYIDSFVDVDDDDIDDLDNHRIPPSHNAELDLEIENSQERLEIIRATRQVDAKRQAEEDGVVYEDSTIEVIEEDDDEENDLSVVPSMIELVSSIKGRLCSIGEKLERNIHHSDLMHIVDEEVGNIKSLEIQLTIAKEELCSYADNYEQTV